VSGGSVDSAVSAAAAIRDRLEERNPQVAVVLGSGLGGLANAVADSVRIRYEDIPGLPPTSVRGHRGEMIAGRLGDTDVLLQSGRFHLYEGHAPETVILPVRVFAELGCRVLIVTNAAGGIRHAFIPPVLMLIGDHINLQCRNPLAGPIVGAESRFPDMLAAYDPALRRIAQDIACENGIALEHGVYAGVLGPSYETPAEIRMLERLGADAVGMSTVPEVIAARAAGLRVLGISTITNLAAGRSLHKLSHEEVLEAGRAAGGMLEALVQGVVARCVTADGF
jgi:purine-nucleoside phosphorylase